MANFVISPIAVANAIAAAFLKSGSAEYNSQSLIESSRAARVEPQVAIDSSIQAQPFMSDVLQSLCSLVSAYYLQAAALSTRIGDITVLQKLDRLNPERNLKLATYGRIAGVESYHYALPDYGTTPQPYNSVAGIESIASSLIATGVGAAMDANKRPPIRGAEFGVRQTAGGQQFDNRQQMNATISKAENLMVGKVLEVEFLSDDGTKRVVVPVTVKLVPSSVSPSIFPQMFANTGLRNTTSERWHRVSAGELTFWGDFVFGNDLIDKHRAASMKDTSGFYTAVSKRRNNNTAAALMSGQASLADASNIIVISKRTALMIEAEVMGKLSSIPTRNQIFAVSSMMLICVVDQELERITVYHRGIDLPSNLSLRDIKAASKGNGIDIADVLKAYQVNKAPSLY